VIVHSQEDIHGNRHKWAKKYKKTMGRERGPLTKLKMLQKGYGFLSKKNYVPERVWAK
jgi:hypothetical protein